MKASEKQFPAWEGVIVSRTCSRFFIFVSICVISSGARESARGADDKAVPDALKQLQLEMTAKELVQVRSELRKTQLEMEFWKAREETFSKLPIPKSALEERLSIDPAIMKNAARLTEIREHIAGIEGTVTPEKATKMLKDLRSQLNSVEKNVDALKEVLRPRILQQMREKAYDEYKGKITQFQEQIDWLKELDKSLTIEVQRLAAETRDSQPTAEQRLKQVENELRELKAAVAELKKAK